MIRAMDIHFSYLFGVEVLQGVSIEIGDGEFVALMGENGAGKTTLVKHFNGLLKPTRGDVFVDGRNTRELSVAELSRKVGLVFQNPDHQLFCESVENEIAFSLRNFGFDEATVSKRVKWALNFLDLVRYRKTSPFMLSGGERKRVVLASVLAWDPEIVILDEPTIGQDYHQKEKLLHFIRQLNAQGKTVIIVTHDVEFVVDCNPRVVLISHGRIVGDSSAKEVLTDRVVVKKASLVLPQITKLFYQLRGLGLPRNVMDVDEAERLLVGLVRRSDA